MTAVHPPTVVFAEEDTLFRLMEMALLRKATQPGVKTLTYFFGDEIAEPLAMLTSMADRLGLPRDVAAMVAQDAAQLDRVLPQADVLVLERTEITAALIAAGGGRLKLIQQFGQDTRHIDIAAARSGGVMVANLLRYSNLSCADHVVALIFACARDLLHAHAIVTSRRDQGPAGFASDPPRNTFNWGRVRDIRVLSDQTVGFIGMGEIAGLVARRLTGMGIAVLYNKRTRLASAEEAALGGVVCVPRDELLARADFVSIHVPYGADTEKLVDAAFLAAMKRGAYLINTARGGIVDERALFEALRNGHLAGAALDVYRYEPVPADCPLLDLENVLWTPHMSGGRPEFMIRESEDVLSNIARVLRGEAPAGQLGPP